MTALLLSVNCLLSRPQQRQYRHEPVEKGGQAASCVSPEIQAEAKAEEGAKIFGLRQFFWGDAEEACGLLSTSHFGYDD